MPYLNMMITPGYALAPLTGTAGPADAHAYLLYSRVLAWLARNPANMSSPGTSSFIGELFILMMIYELFPYF